MKYWVVSAGAFGRDYADLFCRFGIAFVGGEDQCRTMRQVKEGDRVLLKRGVTEILAVGTVVARNGVVTASDDNKWFHDIDGWQLPTYCHVDWCKLTKPVQVNGLKQGTIYETPQQQLRKV